MQQSVLSFEGNILAGTWPWAVQKLDWVGKCLNFCGIYLSLWSVCALPRSPACEHHRAHAATSAWCHQCNESICFAVCPDGADVFRLTYDRWWESWHGAEAHCFWSSFLTGIETYTFAQSVAAYYIPETILSALAKKLHLAGQLWAGLFLGWASSSLQGPSGFCKNQTCKLNRYFRDHHACIFKEWH